MTEFKRTEAEINLDSARKNYLEIKRLTNGADIIAVIKANAYGHGDVELGHLYEKLGSPILAVACLSEALKLRQSGISVPILIFGRTPPALASVLSENNFIQSVFSYEYSKELSDAASSPVSVHIKLDTGMTRLGIYAHEGHTLSAADEAEKICALKNISAEGIFTHFADSDGETRDFTEEQLASFLATVDELSSRGLSFKFCHCANSGAVLHYKKAHLSCVRPGLILYGVCPDDKPHDLKLSPVMTFKSTIADIRHIKQGDTVSYGRTYTAERDMRVAVVSAGYADGIPRLLSNKASFLVCGKRAPVLGRICMDLLVVDVSEIPEAKIGGEVVFFGEQNGKSISATEFAALAGTISYEALTSVSLRANYTFLSSGI